MAGHDITYLYSMPVNEGPATIAGKPGKRASWHCPDGNVGDCVFRCEAALAEWPAAYARMLESIKEHRAAVHGAKKP